MGAADVCMQVGSVLIGTAKIMQLLPGPANQKPPLSATHGSLGKSSPGVLLMMVDTLQSTRQ
jgi:hypothetical protein